MDFLGPAASRSVFLAHPSTIGSARCPVPDGFFSVEVGPNRSAPREIAAADLVRSARAG
jgi:hypothetical protein